MVDSMISSPWCTINERIIQFVSSHFLSYQISHCFRVFSDSDTVLNIDIYQNDMTYEKYKQHVIDYADKSPYPSLTSK